MSHSIPDPPSVSYWEASPDFRALCRRKLPADAYAWAEPQLAAMGERAAIASASSSTTPRIARWSASRTAPG